MTVQQVGTRLRDAAVDPRPGDHLPPVNAGQPGPVGNPHGPRVVSVQAESPRSGRAPHVAGSEHEAEAVDRG